MSTESLLFERSESKCELCSATAQLGIYEVPPKSDGSVDQCILLCETCRTQIKLSETDMSQVDVNHWRCLNDSMWSQIPAVQVMAWRMLNRLSAEGWPQELLELLYLDDALLEWAQSGQSSPGSDATSSQHKDSNGATLLAGDTVTLTKDLTVKGANFTAKRGTAVRNISLVESNPEHIEGKINGQQIVILTKFVKK